MQLRILFIPLAVLATIMVIGAPTASAQAPGGPSAGTKLTGDLREPRGMKVGPDGMIYVAEAGTAGTIAVGSGDTASKSGNTGRISKIDPATGTRTTVADGLPSNGGGEGNVGPADVAFIGSQLYYVQTHGGAVFGFPTTPTGIYKVNGNGTTTLVADIGAYEEAHASTTSQGDHEPGGNPYSMTVRDGSFFVVDGNQNRLLKATTAGVVSLVVDWPSDITTTGITFAGSGPFYVSTLGPFPFAPADGRVYSVGYPSGTLNQVASGFSLTDVDLASNGQLYALSFADQATAPNGPPFSPFSAKVLRVNTSNGTMTPIVDRFTFSTGMVFIGDTLYVTNNGISALGPGEIWKIPAFSTITPIPLTAPTPAAPAPTAAAPAAPPATGGTAAGILAPNTGSGAASPSGGDSGIWIFALALAVLGLAAIGGALATERR